MFGGFTDLCIGAVALSSFHYTVNAQPTYDAIIVGSGPGGLVAAEFLSRDPSVSVLIIEAGPLSLQATGGTLIPDYSRSLGLTIFDIPGEYENIAFRSQFTQFRVEWISSPGTWLGKLVGGSSSLNGAIYTRPPNDYVTKTQWPFTVDSMNIKMDENERIHSATDKPSTDGNWYLQEGYKVVSRALLAQSYSEMTLNDAAARNNKSKTFGHPPFTIKNGRRDSPANELWNRMKTRENVRLLTNTVVDYVLHSEGKATGVMYGDTMARLSSRGAIVMAAGALSTPKILIQSGIGPIGQLNLLQGNASFRGISQGEWIVNPQVGRNLFDSNMVIASFSHPEMNSFRFADYPSWALDQYVNQNGSGPWSSSGPVMIAYENFEVQGRQYEFQATVLPHGFGQYSSGNTNLALALYLTNPEIRAACGFTNTGIWQASQEANVYTGTARDVAALQQYAQRVVNYMTSGGATFLSGASDPNGVANWVLSQLGGATQHFGGSCYASTDASAESKRCADEKLRVLGTSNIFIADASAMREGTVNPYAFVMYIGREAADQVASYISSSGDSATPTRPCSPIEENVDYYGNDVGNAQSTTAESCCAICQNTNGCTVYTWTNYNGGTCWLKSTKGPASTSQGARSAQVN